jgi:E3 ubiquitin-protein ligase SHPRH
MICVSCFRELRKAQTGDRCPTCKSPIENNKRYAKVPLKTMANTATVEEVVENEPVDAPEDSTAVQRRGEWARLRMLDQHRRDTIDTMDVMGNYGAKITFLLKHQQWFRLTRPQVRHVVFSNWADSLSIVEAALTANNIKFVSFDRNTKRNDVVQQFHADPSINVFLLHAERESAGLTLTSCGVVHLLEPVLHHSYELQAIGRVDRLGQKKETEVYCYATLETVEARILCQAVPKGTSIYLNDTDESDRAIEDMPNVASAARGGGDINIADPNGNAELLSLIM